MSEETKRIVLGGDVWTADPAVVAMSTIAACAPEALRLLLANQWHVNRRDEMVCIVCGVEQARDGSHPDVPCELEATMRKAGLRE